MGLLGQPLRRAGLERAGVARAAGCADDRRGTAFGAPLSATSRLPRQTGGATGLYNTTLAAYERVRSGWDPADVNSVVLLTDGANTSPGTSLGALLSRQAGAATSQSLRLPDDLVPAHAPLPVAAAPETRSSLPAQGRHSRLPSQ